MTGAVPDFRVSPDVWQYAHVEAALFAACLKPALKLEDLTPVEGRSWRQKIASIQDVVSSLKDQRALPSPESRLLGRAGGTFKHPITLYVAHRPEVLAELLRVEDEQKTGGPRRAEAIRTAGRLLGYPPCCTAAFADLPRQDDPVVVASYGRSAPSNGMVRSLVSESPLLNFFPPLAAPVTWYPCSFSCTASLDAARAGHARLAPEAAQDLTAFLSGVVLAFDRFRFLHLHDARVESGRILYDGVSDALSTPSAPLALSRSSRLRAFRRMVSTVVAGGRELVVAGDRIVVSSSDGSQSSGVLLEPLTVVWFPSPRDDGGHS